MIALIAELRVIDGRVAARAVQRARSLISVRLTLRPALNCKRLCWADTEKRIKLRYWKN